MSSLVDFNASLNNTNEVSEKLVVLSKILNLAKSLGLEASRLQLLPLLTDFESLKNICIRSIKIFNHNHLLFFEIEICKDPNTEDECMLSIATTLGSEEMIQAIGGDEFITHLFPLLLALASVEETVVRDAATKAIRNIFRKVTPSNSRESFDFVGKLLKGNAAVEVEGGEDNDSDDWFPLKVSATEIISALYPMVQASFQDELISMYGKLAHDDTPIVRRFAAKNVAGFVAVVDDKVLIEKLMPIVQALATDDQATVKTPVIECFHEIMARLSPKQAADSMRAIVLSCTEDRLWKIRLSISSNFGPCVQYFPPELILKEFLPAIVGLLQDSEQQVRAAAVKNIDIIHKLIPEKSYDDQILPIIKTLVDDVNTSVRVNLAEEVMKLLPKLKGKSVDKVLHIITDNLLQDVFNEVRLTVLLNMNQFMNLSKEAIYSVLLPAIKSIKSDKHWRIRRAVLEGIPNLAKNLNSDEFGTHFLELYISAFDDSVSAIRMCCGSCLHQLCKIYGEKWTIAHFVPKLLGLWDHAVGYQQKITVLYSIQELASEFTDKTIFKDLVIRVIQGIQDPTPNVQFIAIQTISKILPYLDTSVRTSQLNPVLAAIKDSSDTDVLFYLEELKRKL